MNWPDSRFLQLAGIECPLLQAPMAGAGRISLAIAVAQAGGLGALPCAMLTPDRIVAQMAAIRAATAHPVNLNFFCHKNPVLDPARDARWRERLAAYYSEMGVDPNAAPAGPVRKPFDDDACTAVEECRPEVVSFHFGLPEPALLGRVRATGARILGCATTVEEARWLEARGCDAIIAQGWEAGGHRGMFLTSDIARQVGTMALVPQLVDAVRVPVIAAGGIADGRGVAAAIALGAAGVQIGTAYLICPEATIGATHRELLRAADDGATVVTNVYTGRPARGFVTRVVRAGRCPATPRNSRSQRQGWQGCGRQRKRAGQASSPRCGPGRRQH